MTIKNLRAQTKLSQSKFAAKFNIPIRTVQAWEQGQSTPPKYVVEMITRLMMMEKPKDFEPMCDSKFLISHVDSNDKRCLVELHEDELVELRSEINTILAKRGNLHV